MSKKPFLIVAFLVIAAIAFSLILLPKTAELALMEKKDKHFEEALTAYELQRTQGTLTLELADQLSQLYLQKGQVDKAIEVMEAYVKDHPTDLDARQRLGRYYQYAQRNDDYLRNLEEINKLTPTPENLKTLSDIYNFKAEYGKQTQTLKQLVAVEKGNEPKHYMDLANIQASNKDFSGAIDTLTAFKKAFPQQFGFDETLLLVSLELDQKKQDDALQVAIDWQTPHTDDYPHVAKLVNMLHFKGSPELASKLLGLYKDEQIDASADLLQEKILIELAMGQDDDAYARLKKLEDAGTLQPALKERLLYLALSRNDRPLADKMQGEVDFTTLNEAQLSALAELAMLRSDEKLLHQMRTIFPDDDSNAHPVLSAILAMGLHEKSTNQKLAELEKQDISVPDRLQIARACAHTGRSECARDFLHKLPQASDMNDSDLASAVEIYLDIKAWQDGEALLDQAQNRDSRELVQVRLKYAAVRGDSKTVEAWLNQNSNTASPRLLADLFFLSYNNNHLALATEIAETFHAREDSPLSRSCLAEVYVKTGQFKQAVALLRDANKRTPDDESNYLFALAKLAPSNPEYRKELASYAEKRLNSNLPEKQKMALIYALVSAHDVEPAMPYIKQLALHNGSQWADLYATQLDKEGKHDEARQFWIQLAAQPHTPVSEKRNIAYTLMDNGYHDDAEHIFSNLAQNENAKGKDTQALLYMWGPRPSQDKIDWIADRMQHAQGADREAWASILADDISDEGMIELANRSPNALNSPVLADRYIDALTRQNQFAQQYPAIKKLATENDRTDLLLIYARAARDNGAYAQASDAYNTLFKLGGGDLGVMREAGVFDYSRANYGAARLYLGEYASAPADIRASDLDAYDAYFTYAEILRHDGDVDDAKNYYKMAYDQMGTAHRGSAEMLSKRAQAQVWSGDERGGLTSFQDAIKFYPNDDSLRADYASTLLDLGRYKQARKLLATPPSAEPEATTVAATSASLPASVRRYTLASNDTELSLYFDGGNANAPKEIFKTLSGLPGVDSISDGYDMVLVQALPGSKFKVDDTNNVYHVSTMTDAASTNAQAANQMALRYQLLDARVDLETGHVDEANSRINDALHSYPNDPQVLGFAANAENYSGNWPLAQQELAAGKQLAPENEDIAKLDKDMRRENAPDVKLDEEFYRLGNDDQFITTLSGYTYLNRNFQLGGSAQDIRVLAKNDRLSDGRVGNFNDWKQNAEVYGLYDWEGGSYVKGSLFANNDTLGVGGYYHFTDFAGESLITGEFKKPYTEYAETVLDDATRDRIGWTQTYKPLTRLTISGGPAYNRYDTKDTNDVFSSAEMNLNVIYRLMDEQPFVAVAYGYDGEYELSRKKSFDALGNYDYLTPVRTREVHVVSLNGQYDFTNTTYGEGLIGYGVDRFGGHGPVIEGKLTHDFTDQIDGQIRAMYGFDGGASGAAGGNSSDSSETRAGAYLRWKY